jgi:hypothetical protein
LLSQPPGATSRQVQFHVTVQTPVISHLSLKTEVTDFGDSLRNIREGVLKMSVFWEVAACSLYKLSDVSELLTAMSHPGDLGNTVDQFLRD